MSGLSSRRVVHSRERVDVSLLGALVEVLPPSFEGVEQLDLAMTLRIEPLEEGSHLGRKEMILSARCQPCPDRMGSGQGRTC